ncbi:F0F1 ATP synthase subunit A [Alicyclobacillus herbarius]|uniref:F0F1 ATP synthase subunit A n=1 Tax=Alicyclobacillus herbarius TaxID=122960 RepID=UPI00040F3DB7|nr:F0F1 ATP synthase subunit A [Alicyclobacillus herbarius]
MTPFPTLFKGTIWATNLTTVAMTILAGLLVLVFVRLGVRRMDMRSPRGMQNVVEWTAEFVTNMARETMPNERIVQWVLPLAFMMLVFLFIANWLGLIFVLDLKIGHPIPWLGITAEDIAKAHQSGKEFAIELFNSPTANMSMALGLAIMVWVISHAIGLRHPLQWLKHYKNPMAILEEITNPLTHGMRLYGNIFAGEALIGVLAGAPMIFGFIPWSLPLLVVWVFYSAFVSTIQAYVFTILMTLYIGNKAHGDGDHEATA